MLFRPVAMLLALSGCVPAEWIPAERKEPPTARPTEVLPEDIPAKRARSKARKDWLKQRHAAGPDVDWQQVERDNGRARIDRRNALTTTPPPGGAPDDADRWTERGSENQAGRTHVTRFGTDGTTLYVGAAAGGVWRRTGDAWEPLGDGLFGGVHWLEVLPSDDGGPDVLVTGTDGGYLYRSVDDGRTWQAGSGLASAWSQRRLARASDGSGTLYAVRGGNEGFGAWRSDDGAASWTKIFDLGDFAGDLFVPRTGSASIYLATREGLQRSDDRGATWTSVGGWPDADATDLAGSEAWSGAGGEPRLYAVQDGRTLLRSDDGGRTFLTLGSVTDYWGNLTASATDDAFVVYGGVELRKSADAGATFSIQNGWSEYYDDVENKLHADIMGVDVLPDGSGGETWFLNTDGGTYRSDDGLSTVKNQSLRGLRVSQYYTTLTSAANPAHVAAGSQDQGYQVSVGQPTTEHLFDFDQILSGDYAHLTSGDGTHDLVYSVYPGFVLIQIDEEEPQLSYESFPSDAASHAWLPVLLADPDDRTAFYFGGDKLWKYSRQNRWNWTSALHSEQDFQRSGGEYVSGLAFAPGNHDRMYAVTSSGRFFRSDDHGVTWSNGSTGLPWGQYFYGTAIVASALDTDTVYVGGSGYSNAPVWVSRDGGDTFTELSAGLPDTLVYALAEEPSSGTLFAGTETSAWRLLPGAAAWEDITGAEAPLVVYWSAEIVPDSGLVRFGTYGRGIWDYVYDADLDGFVDGLDADADGSEAPDDCNDTDASVHPGAEDTCGDGLDQDCDGGDATCPDDTDAGPGGRDDGTDEACGCASGSGGTPYMLTVLFAGLMLARRGRTVRAQRTVTLS